MLKVAKGPLCTFKELLKLLRIVEKDCHAVRLDIESDVAVS